MHEYKIVHINSKNKFIIKVHYNLENSEFLMECESQGKIIK